MSRIFLSHSSANNGPAVALHSWLKAEGWDDVFLDLDADRGIRPGERWEKALNQAVYRCEAVLFLVSKAWLASQWCLNEFHLATKTNKPLFGILIEDIAVKDLPTQLTSTWQLVHLAQGNDQEPFEATTPDGQRHYGLFSKTGLRRLKEGLVKAGLDPRFFDWPPAHDPMRPPYRGLLPLESDDAGIFFGREAPIIETLDKLRGLRQVATSHLLVILGASGSGKSSFLRAGIMPRLMRDDRNFLMLPVIRPERAVMSGETGLLRSLEKACAAVGLLQTRAEIKKVLAAGATDVLSLLANLARRAMPPRLDGEAEAKPPSLVLAVDQGEELFQAEGGEESQAFRALLKDLLTADDANLIVLITIRSDAYASLQAEPLLKDVHQQPVNLPPVPRGAYQTIIEGPALRLKDTKRPLKIDPKLTTALLQDVEEGGAKDALPLLAFTLERLYLEHGGDGDLRLDEYRDIGGITGSIEAAVEQALKAADADTAVPRDRLARLALLRRAFIPWLAGIDPDTGSPRRAIARMSDIPEESRPLVKHLIAQRLLATDRSASGEQTIEPAHEALLRQWALLNGWLSEDFAQLASLEGVKRATRDWLANGKSSDWLAHNAGRLEDAERLEARSDLAAKLAADDLDYLAQCRAAEISRKDKELRQAKKLARAIAMGLAAAILLAVAAAGFGYYGVQKANEAEQQAKVAEGEKRRALYNEGIALSGLSRVALSEGSPLQAVKLALAAWPRTGNEDRPALRRTIESLAAAFLQQRQRRLLTRDEDYVRSAAFSPDGTRVLTVSGTTRLWDATTGAGIAVLKGHKSAVWSAAFSPDGTRVVTASWDSTARLWDAKTGVGIAVLEGHKDIVRFAAFSSDGTRVVTASQDKTARLWDATTGAGIAVLKGHEGIVTYAVFSQDGARVVTASDDKTARLWDATTGAKIAVLKGHEDTAWSAAFSPDGTRVVTASQDKTARLWDATTGAGIAALEGHEGAVTSAVFSPDGTRVVTASPDTTARLWDAKTGVGIAVLKGHEGSVGSAAFSPDGTRVVTASWDGTARLWDATTGAGIAIFEGHESPVTSAAFSPDGMRVVTTSQDKTARFWDAKVGARIAIFEGHESPVTSAGFSPDGTRVVTASADKTARLWDAKTGAGIIVLTGHGEIVWSAAFSPDGTRVVTASWDGTARLWDTTTGARITILKGHKGVVLSAAFSPDGTRVVTASSDMTARLWDTKTGAGIAVLEGHKSPVTSAAFSPDGTRIVTASADKTARLWDATTGAPITVLDGHGSAVSSAAFSPDGTRVVTASSDRTARLWDTKTGVGIAVLEGHEDHVNSAAFSPDGTRVVTASWDKTARLWDAQTGARIAVLEGHEDHVNSAAFSPDGTRVVTASDDKTARLWDISDLEKGDAFSLSCQRLGNDTDLADVRQRYGLGEMVPICGANAPLPVDWTKLR